MAYNLYLDDFRDPIDSSYYRNEPVYTNLDWIVVRNYDEFTKKIEELGIPEVVSFDHDLADVHYEKQQFNYNDETQEKTGYHCAKWLIYYCIDNKKDLPAMILVHSMNPAGTQNIWSLFNTYWKSLSPSS
jgi:hypothetical protein